MSKSINFAVNGAATTASCRPDMTVLEWLRGKALLRGTKEGCAEGDCGACSVLVRRPSTLSSKGAKAKPEKYKAANACIMLMGQLEGASLLTVEGLAELDEEGHPVQQLMAQNGSSQCGFCTPGIVVSLAGLLDANKSIDEQAVHDALAGNLCRCTGYKPIVEAAQAAASHPKVKLPAPRVDKPSKEVGSSECRFFLPDSLDELLALKSRHKGAVLLAGGTDLCIDVAHARSRWPQALLTRNVAEMREISKTADTITFGGAVTWQEALPHLQRYWPSFATLVRRFGSTQIRSMGTIAGNIGTASPIGDGAPALIALDAHLTLANARGSREVPLDKFFKGYRKTVLKSDELITGITVPLPKKSSHFRVYKISKRYDQDISTVCGAFAVEMSKGEITYCRMAFGGMAATPLRCTKAERALIGNLPTEMAIENAKMAVRETFEPMTDMRGSAAYRTDVAANLLERLFLDIEGQTIEVMAL